MAATSQPARKPPTMADVAKRAKVSTAAVSYFLSGDSARLKRVGAEAQRRILEAVTELNYVQNRAARELRRRRSERICLLLPRLGIPFSDRIAQDVRAEAAKRTFSTIISAAQAYETIDRAVREIESGLADGLIADWQHLTRAEVEGLVRRLALANVPAIVFHPTMVPTTCSVVRQHTAEGVSAALDYLFEGGHRRIGYMRHEFGAERGRHAAYRAFLKRRNLPLDPAIVVSGAESRPAAHASASALIRLVDRPTALLAESDFAAVTAINAFRAAGLQVPGDIAVVGSGNVDEGQFSCPALTTTGPQSLSFSHFADHLIDRISGEASAAPRLFNLPWILVRRESA